MLLLAGIASTRRRLADRLLASIHIPISANDVTRLGAWACFASAMTMLIGAIGPAIALLALGLALDALDGGAARAEGASAPQVDWAADRFTEAIFIGPLFLTQPLVVALAFVAGYAVNVFLPRGRVPVLALRFSLLVYLVVAGVVGIA